VRVEGIVQGVGFRPYVYALATSLRLDGFVGNDVGGVIIEAEGTPDAVDRFVVRLPVEAPPMSVIERIETRALPAQGGEGERQRAGGRGSEGEGERQRAGGRGSERVGERVSGFSIVRSDATGQRVVPVSPDAATCADCLHELRDPADRRHRYPFINCTNCGPRYTIVRDVPYDRPATTMAVFEMCADCAREYHDPTDRRFHAQPVCCPACGPRLTLRSANGKVLDGDPIATAARLLHRGDVVAIKGIGGYHLAVDATNEHAVALLRSRKHREDRPFAVMVAGLPTARSLCKVGAREAALLLGPAAPIVLLRRTAGAGATVAPSVAPGNRWLGLMVAYTPLHHLLAEAVGRPFVLTSGNVSDEPIAYTDDDARTRLASIADALLAHDRPIHMRVDDSVVRVVGSRPLPVRRSRGFAPQPVTTKWAFPRHVLAVGAELKNTVCVAKGQHAFVSHHIGDLENYETFRSFTEAIAHLSRLFDVTPQAVAYDLHPEYLATKHALELDGVDLVGVQHHHAHIASCMADNGLSGPVIGVAFDGTGYGTDGTLWGGEILVADLEQFSRAGNFAPVPLPGGATAIREPWRMAASYLRAAYGDDLPGDLAVTARHRDRWDHVLAATAAGINAPLTSSAGRLFDAVAALLGVRDTVTYEGQAAIELEQLAAPAVTDRHRAGLTGGYRAGLTGTEPFTICGADLIRAVVDDVRSGVSAPVIAARFHAGVARAIAEACERTRASTGLQIVALSGGVFQNVLLVDATVTRLQAAGFTVLTHHRVPPNDGGISLGQAVIAAARDRAAARTDRSHT
jgi:hydrogenase maturation protein HypF